MYYYIFDPPVGANDYQRTSLIKEKLSTLGIAGEMASPMPGRTVADLVHNAISKRYSTIVAVGDMPLINQVAQALEPYDAVLGIIPFHDDPDLAQLIGVHTWEEATEQLKKRRCQPVRLGLIKGGGCFLTPATIVVPPRDAIELDTPDFTARQEGGTVTIVPGQNQDDATEHGLLIRIDMAEQSKGGFFSSLFGSKPPLPRNSQFTTSNLTVSTPTPLPVIVAGATMGQTPLTFTTQAKPVRLIVARQGASIA